MGNLTVLLRTYHNFLFVCSFLECQVSVRCQCLLRSSIYSFRKVIIVAYGFFRCVRIEHEPCSVFTNT